MEKQISSPQGKALETIDKLDIRNSVSTLGARSSEEEVAEMTRAFCTNNWTPQSNNLNKTQDPAHTNRSGRLSLTRSHGVDGHFSQNKFWLSETSSSTDTSLEYQNRSLILRADNPLVNLSETLKSDPRYTVRDSLSYREKYQSNPDMALVSSISDGTLGSLYTQRMESISCVDTDKSVTEETEKSALDTKLQTKSDPDLYKELIQRTSLEEIPAPISTPPLLSHNGVIGCESPSTATPFVSTDTECGPGSNVTCLSDDDDDGFGSYLRLPDELLHIACDWIIVDTDYDDISSGITGKVKRSNSDSNQLLKLSINSSSLSRRTPDQLCSCSSRTNSSINSCSKTRREFDIDDGSVISKRRMIASVGVPRLEITPSARASFQDEFEALAESGEMSETWRNEVLKLPTHQHSQ